MTKTQSRKEMADEIARFKDRCAHLQFALDVATETQHRPVAQSPESETSGKSVLNPRADILAEAENVVRVGITGYATSGKDVIADVLVAHYGFVKIGMSDALNNYLRILNPVVSLELRYDEAVSTHGYVEAKARYPEVRRLLQVMGTEVGRSIDSDMWVKELNKLASEHQRVVTTGIRFPNEYADLTCLIAVERPGVGPLNDHPSENIDDIINQSDYYFHNNGTIKHLQDDIRQYARSIMTQTRGTQR